MAQDNAESDRFCSPSNVSYCFELYRKDGDKARRSAGSGRNVNKQTEELFFYVGKNIAVDKGLEFDERMKLNSNLSEFVLALGLDIEDILGNLTDESLEIFQILKNSYIPKKYILPKIMQKKNDNIAESYDLKNTYFSIYRFRGLFGNEHKLVEEKLKINVNSAPRMEYVDHDNIVFQGVPLFSKTKIVCLLVSQESSDSHFATALVNVFRQPISDMEYLVTVLRNSVDGIDHCYKAIGIPRHSDFPVAQAIGPTDTRVIRYLLTLDNSGIYADQLKSSFEINVGEARNLLNRGISLEREYLENNEEYKNITDSKNIIDRILQEQ